MTGRAKIRQTKIMFHEMESLNAPQITVILVIAVFAPFFWLEVFKAVLGEGVGKQIGDL